MYFLFNTTLWVLKVCRIHPFPNMTVPFFYDRTTITLNICQNLGKRENIYLGLLNIVGSCIVQSQILNTIL